MSNSERANSQTPESSGNIEVHIPQTTTFVEVTNQQQQQHQAFEEADHVPDANHQNPGDSPETNGPEKEIEKQQNRVPEQVEEKLAVNQQSSNDAQSITLETGPKKSAEQEEQVANENLAEKVPKEQKSDPQLEAEEGNLTSEQPSSYAETNKQNEDKAEATEPSERQQQQSTVDEDTIQGKISSSPVKEITVTEDTEKLTTAEQHTVISHVEGDKSFENASSKEPIAEDRKDASQQQAPVPSAGTDAIDQDKRKDKNSHRSTDVEAGHEETILDITQPNQSANLKESAQTNQEPRRSSAASSSNVEAMNGAVDARKEPEAGSVLSSPTKDGEKELNDAQASQRKTGGGSKDDARPTMATTKVKFQAKNAPEETYMTETPSQDIIERERRASHTYSPAYIDTGGRQSPEGEQQAKNKEKKEPVRSRAVSRLKSSKPPKYVLKLRPMKADPDPKNRAPLNPNIYYAEVPKEGGHVKTPFYMQVDIPDGTLDGNVRLKFERQEYDRMKLGLTQSDTLCSCIMDLNMEPLTYCLRQNVTVRMRILHKCINKHEDIIIITARHFSWIRVPTKIESKSINGEKHYYAVTRSQSFGKFAVIGTQKMDRFIITNAGGIFKSTIVPEIELHVDEHHLENHPPQIIEMVVRKTRDDAIKQVTQEIPQVQDVEGKLVAASAMIEINKDLMGQSGKMQSGIQFPDKLSLKVPVPKPPPGSKDDLPPKRRIIIMQKLCSNPNYNTVNGYRHRLSAYSKSQNQLWDDVTEASRMSVEAVTFTPNEVMSITITAPGKFMVLVFEEDSKPPLKSGAQLLDADIDDLMFTIIEENQAFLVKIMVHQKISQPSIIFIHIVTSDAVGPICETMQSTEVWKSICTSEQIIMREWQPINLEFTGDLQPTVNQMSPKLRFYSRRWQGYQIQLEATEKAFKTFSEKYTGEIAFVEPEDNRSTIQRKSATSIKSDDQQLTPEQKVLCCADVEIERDQAKPYHPTVIVKQVPKVPIFREYKMKWLNNLSQEEIDRYRSAQGI